ncbi:hypothetical protein ACFFRR_004157 [Megaselia abdita]
MCVLDLPFYFINIKTTRVASGSKSDSHERKFLTCALRIEFRIVRLESESAKTYTNLSGILELPRNSFSHIVKNLETFFLPRNRFHIKFSTPLKIPCSKRNVNLHVA